MAEYAHPDFKEKVDEKKLRVSNDLGKKWAERFGIKKNNHLKFMIALMKNKKKYLDSLDSRYKSQFSKDYSKMFYAYEIENIVVEQYYHCVAHCLAKLNIPEHLRDDFQAIGLMGLRSAIWNFRTHKANATLFTYCFNGVFNRILGLKTKHAKSFTKVRKIKLHLETDCFNPSHNSRQLNNICSVNVNFDIQIQEKECAEIYAQLLEKTNLKEDEMFLFQNYFTRNEGTANWCQLYRDKYPNESGSKISRQGVHVKLAIVKRKLWKTYSTIRKTNYLDLRNKFAV
jgi:hypothetical protein